MMISVEHATVYAYDSPVVLKPHTIRLRPRMTSSQRLLAYDLQIDPIPAGTSECLDQDGNLALSASFDMPANELKVRSRFTVELVQKNAFDYVLTGETMRLPLWYSGSLCSALAPYRNDLSLGEPVKLYANVVAAGANWDARLFLSTLNQKLFEGCRHITRPEGPPWLSYQTLSMMEGSCRDLAVLFCDLCRTVGIAARFVSGYECASAGRHDSYMHAWAEVYLPGAGWRGYDPSRGLAVANTHVAVAAGFDYDLASPIAGAYFGGSGSRMETSLSMSIAPEHP
jgi:transglutaminase-like putative cysteine protease